MSFDLRPRWPRRLVVTHALYCVKVTHALYCVNLPLYFSVCCEDRARFQLRSQTRPPIGLVVGGVAPWAPQVAPIKGVSKVVGREGGGGHGVASPTISAVERCVELSYSLRNAEGSHNGSAAVLKTAGRKAMQVRVLSPPPFLFNRLPRSSNHIPSVPLASCRTI